MISRFPGIEKAALEIFYDNGGINRFRSMEQALMDCREYLETCAYYNFLPDIDAWLSSQSEDALETIAVGEHEEMKVALADAPPFIDDLLNGIFEEVC